MKQKIIQLLRWSQKYTQTDMLYIARGGFWLMMGRIVVFLISFATLTAFANWVSKEVYGIYSYFLATITLLGIFALPGIHSALLRSIARGKEGTLGLVVKTKLKWSLIGSAGSLLISVWYFSHHNIILGVIFLLGVLFVPLPQILPVVSSFWQGKKKFARQSKYEIFSAFLSSLIIIPVIYFTNNIIFILIAFFASHALFDGLLLKRTLKMTSNNQQEIKAVSFGKHLTAMHTIRLLSTQADKIIIWHFLGPVSVAVYLFAKSPINKILELIPIVPLALPKLSKKNIKGIKPGLFKKLIKLLCLAGLFGLAVFAIGPFAYKIIFPAYLESIPYFRALSLLILFIPFQLLEASLLAAMRQKYLYIIQTVAPFFRIIFFLALVPFYGIWGIIIAIFIAEMMYNGLLVYFIKKV